MLERLYKETPELSEFANDYYEYCNKQAGDLRSATVSVISTAGVAPFREFCISQVEEENVEHWEWVERDKIQHFDRRKADHLFYDLESYIPLHRHAAGYQPACRIDGGGGEMQGRHGILSAGHALRFPTSGSIAG